MSLTVPRYILSWNTFAKTDLKISLGNKGDQRFGKTNTVLEILNTMIMSFVIKRSFD